MARIETIVMLMLENRSLDNLFGNLYNANNQAGRFYPSGSAQQYNGIPPGASNPAFNWLHELQNYPVTQIPIQQIINDGRDPSVIPWWDPTEEYRSITGHGVVNQLFGNQYKQPDLPPSGTRPGMLGFLQDYWEYQVEYPYGGQDILWMFGQNQLPYLYAAAQMGAISDAWFCSVPTQTNPNRAFSLCGTSLGREANLHLSAVEQFNIPTIFNGLAGFNKSCAMYYVDIWQNGQCYTQYTFPQSTQGCGEITTTDQFFARCENGTLPAFTYLEPKWGYGLNAGTEPVQGTDLHPPTSVTPGDTIVGLILSALMYNKKQWPNTLFIITFDEHGGTYDHVPPAWGAVNPDGRIGPTGFGFNLFGVRVPTILISPYITPRTVFRADPNDSPYPFDHTSFLRSLMLWTGGGVSGFFKRAEVAPHFWGVLNASDEEAADNSEAMLKQFAALPEPVAPQMPASNALYDGIPAASVRWIIATSTTAEERMRKIEDYRRDPEAFEAALVPPGGD